MVTRYVEDSPLVNPYIEKEFILEGALDHYYGRKTLGVNILDNNTTGRGRSIVIAPINFKHQNNTVLENRVPTWDITFQQLLDFYDRARFERYIDFTYRKCCWKCTKEKEFKRRITWLFPQSGKSVVYICIQRFIYGL